MTQRVKGEMYTGPYERLKEETEKSSKTKVVLTPF